MVPEGLVLLTSVAFAIGVIRLGRKQCLVQELPAIEGLARVDTVCLDKTGTLTEGGMDVTELRPLGGATSRTYAKSWARSGSRTRGRTPRSRRSSTPTRTARTGAAWSRCRSPPRASTAGRPSARVTASRVRGCWAPRRAAAVPRTRRSPRPSGSTSRGCGCCCWPGPTRTWTIPGSREEARPTALVVLEQRLRPDAADTLPTSPSRTCTPRSSPATTRCRSARSPPSSGCPAPPPRRRPATAHRSGGDGQGAGRGHGVRAGHSAAEAGHGGRPAVARAHGRDDRATASTTYSP
jgi:hypothetical protein